MRAPARRSRVVATRTPPGRPKNVKRDANVQCNWEQIEDVLQVDIVRLSGSFHLSENDTLEFIYMNSLSMELWVTSLRQIWQWLSSDVAMFFALERY